MSVMPSIEYCTIAVSMFWLQIVDIPPLIRRDTCTLCLSVCPSFPGPDQTGLSSCAFVCLSTLHVCTCVFAVILSLQNCFFSFGLSICPKTGSDVATIHPQQRCRWDGNHQSNKNRAKSKDAVRRAALVNVFKLVQTMFLMIIDA
jgi:hypothetical protein